MPPTLRDRGRRHGADALLLGKQRGVSCPARRGEGSPIQAASQCARVRRKTQATAAIPRHGAREALPSSASSPQDSSKRCKVVVGPGSLYQRRWPEAVAYISAARNIASLGAPPWRLMAYVPGNVLHMAARSGNAEARTARTKTKRNETKAPCSSQRALFTPC